MPKPMNNPQNRKIKGLTSMPTKVITGVVLLFSMLCVMQLHPISGQRNMVRPISIFRDANGPFLSFDGSRVSVGPEIGRTEIFDVDTGKKLAHFLDERSDVSLLSPDGKIVKIFGKGIHTSYEIDTGKKLSSASVLMYQAGEKVGGMNVYNRGGSNTRNITSDLKLVANRFIAKGEDRAKKDRPVVVLGRLDNNSFVRAFQASDESLIGDVWHDVTITSDGRFVAATRNNVENPSRNRTEVWNAANGRSVLSLPFNSPWISLSDDGMRICLESDELVQCWNVATGKLISTLIQTVQGRNISVLDGVLSPDGSLLVTTGNNEVFFWNADTGKLVASQNQSQHSGTFAKAVVFSGDGKRIAVGTNTEVVTVWSIDEILGKSDKPMAESKPDKDHLAIGKNAGDS